MIDFMTLKLPFEIAMPLGLDAYRSRSGRLMCLDPNGEIKWERIERESIRSDSHQIVFDVGGDCLMLHGSPARVMHAHNVWGSGDPVECARAMIAFASTHSGVRLPFELNLWKVTRMDVTHNYVLGSSNEVRQALSYLRQSEGGRYQVSTKSETVYWGGNSSLRRMKAYHKGPHLRYLMKKKNETVSFTDEEINLADKLLRLELSLMSQFWRERSLKHWYKYTENELNQIHHKYFSQVIGKIEVVDMDTLLEQIEKTVMYNGKPITKGMALAAYRTYTLIQSIGVRATETSMPRATYLRHRKILFDAGLTHADLHAGNVLPFRRRSIILGEPVYSWSEVRNAA